MLSCRIVGLYTSTERAIQNYSKMSFRLCRFTGRDDELLAVSFLTSGRDFLEKQFDRTSNTAAPFAMGSSGMITELQISLMDDSTGGGADMWKGRAIAFISALNKPMCYFRDKGYLLLEPNSYMDFFRAADPRTDGFREEGDRSTVSKSRSRMSFLTVYSSRLKAFILTLPWDTPTISVASRSKRP
jgi:hypothetical protein